MMIKPRNLFGLISGTIAGGMLLGLTAASLSGGPQQGAEQTYNRKCASCHAKDGSGKTPNGKKYGTKDVRETVKKYSEDQMIKLVKEGKGKNMDSFSDELSADEIKAVTEYYRGLATSK
jgi:mono/diheme cytochrome c family protein